MVTEHIIAEIAALGSSSSAKQCERFFQARPGGYGYGDKFCGASVPDLRKVAKKHSNISLGEIEKLLQNSLHEARFVALVLLIEKFKMAPEEVISVYLANTRFINNWDLVDVAAYKICGEYCQKNNGINIIWELAKSKDLWENRIAIVSSLAFIRNGNLQLTIDLCKHFLNHPHHLMHKACGWMLREVGKRDTNLLLDFVNSHKLPGIMKSYALEIIRKSVQKLIQY
ncbi:MAG: DNA alkylation repair protein [Puniceicoccales bacterium]|jgi:3-methyladenine DNA glycosylase AlkD|nr:DNA alkylation repair protein [Puniceicoccales bacterium]